MTSMDLKKEFVEIGRILKPFGVKGELKLSLYIDNPSDLSNVNEFYIKDKRESSGFKVLTFNALNFSGDLGYAKVKFDQITDRTIAEGLRLTPIFINKNLLTSPVEGEYFIRDLIDLEAWYQDEKIGIVFNIFEVANQQICVIKQEHTNLDLAIPFNERYVSTISLSEQKIFFDHVDELL